MHNKTAEGDVLTLGRALKTETRFPTWVVTTMEALSKAGKPLACVQLTKVLLQADKNAVGVWATKAAYLHGYFFDEFLGLGMPQVTALNSALHAVAVGSSSARGGKEKALSEVVSSGSRRAGWGPAERPPERGRGGGDQLAERRGAGAGPLAGEPDTHAQASSGRRLLASSSGTCGQGEADTRE